MALKRKAQEAFERPQGQLSAFAAAKLARQSGNSSLNPRFENDSEVNENVLAVEAASTPYDGHHSGAVTPNLAFVEEEPILTSPTKSLNTSLSTFALTASNLVHESEQHLELLLKRDETVTIIGEYDVAILGDRGATTIAGTLLQPQHGSRRIFVASVYALPQICSLHDNTTIRISSVKSGVTKLEELSPLFRNIWTAKSAHNRSFCLLGSSDDDAFRRPLNVLEIDRDTDAVLRTISSKSTTGVKKPRAMTIGSKSSGKSTFNRLLCNYFYTLTKGSRLLYLDLDPGQPEFGPPGQVSLVEVDAPILGPPFTHPAWSHSKDFRLVRSHAIASTSFKDDPEHYKSCVIDLFRLADSSKAMIVNTCGWVTGIGANVVAELVPMLGISDVILLEPLEEYVIADLRNESPSSEFHRISRRAAKPLSRTPAEVRAMQMMSYFHYRTNSFVSTSRWSGKPISRLRPWVVNYAGTNPGVRAIMSYGQSPDPKFLAEVLDGSIVAITTVDAHADSMFLEDRMSSAPEAYSTQIESSVDWTPDGIPYVAPNHEGISQKLDPRTSQCIGLALIRGIDTERKELHLVTPLLESQIASLENQEVVLIRGSFDLPEWAYLEDLVKDEKHARSRFDDGKRPWVSEKEMPGIEGSVWRLRHPPVASAVASSR